MIQQLQYIVRFISYDHDPANAMIVNLPPTLPTTDPNNETLNERERNAVERMPNINSTTTTAAIV